jgi:hypothetical protein
MIFTDQTKSNQIRSDLGPMPLWIGGPGGLGFRSIIYDLLHMKLQDRTHMTEKTITNKIIKHITNNYPMALVRKRYSNGSSGTAGWPDITGSICGIRLEIEVKQPGCKPRKLQAIMLDRFKKANIIAFWTDSLQDCLSQLDAALHDWKKPG